MGFYPGGKIKEAFEAISRANREAYRDIFLMSNEVLGRSPSHNNFLDRFVKNENLGRHTFFSILQKTAAYYFKSLAHFMLYLSRFVEFNLADFRFSIYSDQEEIVIIDTVFNMDHISMSGRFSELFFPGLEELLRKDGKYYFYFPYFYSSAYSKKIFELHGVLRLLKRDRVPVLTEFQLLSAADLIRILYFIITYPFHVFQFAKRLKAKGTYETRLISYELIDSIDQVTFYNYSRYLQGKKIAERFSRKNIKVISWYENRPVHKNLYKGLRSFPISVRIYGAQLFLRPTGYLTLLPDENEKPFDVIPDKIIVNGPYYIPETSTLNYVVGPSLRYAKIFSTPINRRGQRNLLVLLPFIMHSLTNILCMLNKAASIKESIFVKIHPGIPPERLRNMLPSGAKIVNEDIYKIFETTRLVIGAASGALLEAASMGIPAVVIKDSDRLDYYNPFPEYGKGIIWEEADSAERLISHICKLERIREENSEQLEEVAGRYKKMFFCEPAEANTREAFEL